MNEIAAGERRGPWAVVVGASGGVGREVALRLSEDGYSVLVCGGDSAGLEETRKLIEWSGGRASELPVDLDDPAAVRRLIGEAAGLLAGAPVEVLVNNAGEVDYGSADDVFALVFELNVRVPLLLAGAFAPLMAARGAGAIVNVGGFGSRPGVSDHGQAQAARAALVTLTRSWSAEYGPRGVRVNFVDPGDRGRPQLYSAGAPQGDDCSAAVAEAFRFLASPRAARVQGALVSMIGEAGEA
ncbi:SDR family NAD(P)-dependent oxidoreductase [Nocardia brasiliensis]